MKQYLNLFVDSLWITIRIDVERDKKNFINVNLSYSSSIIDISNPEELINQR